ncbi:MAG: hypothetical protein A2Y54_03920 [Chloroflexi bacterium RBG_16_51_16]|nr:MAG: hypothetical protein A2Y54_03920 [Chloroflexi bacterium RBG_16_51_16]
MHVGILDTPGIRAELCNLARTANHSITYEILRMDLMCHFSQKKGIEVMINTSFGINSDNVYRKKTADQNL